MGVSLIEKVAIGLVAIGGMSFMYKRLALASPSPAPAPSPVPKPPAKKPSSPSAMNPTPQPSALIYSSLPSNVREKYDRGTLSSGREFTLAPLWDDFNGTWARANYNVSEGILAALGLRMPTFEEGDEIASRPDTLILPLCNQPPTNQMATKAWWDKFDLCVQAALSAAGWNGDTPVMFGKFWALGADPSHSWLHGFYHPKNPLKAGAGYSKIIQNRGKTAHDRGHVDYSQLIYGVAA